jgi:hypothetical protein
MRLYSKSLGCQGEKANFKLRFIIKTVEQGLETLLYLFYSNGYFQGEFEVFIEMNVLFKIINPLPAIRLQ